MNHKNPRLWCGAFAALFACLAAVPLQAADPAPGSTVATVTVEPVFDLYSKSALVKPRVTRPTWEACMAEAVVLGKGDACQSRNGKFTLSKVPAPPVPVVMWTFVSEEGASGAKFTTNAPAKLLFGVSTTAENQVRDIPAGAQEWSYRNFGSDPAPNKAKSFWISPASALVPTPPAPPPVVNPADPGMPQDNGMPKIDLNQATLLRRSPGLTGLRISPIGTDPPPAESDLGAFRNPCGPSHLLFDDPIVYPGRTGAAHLHQFFGNVTTNAYTTTESLAGSTASTCAGGLANLSAYWVPAMVDTKTGLVIWPMTGDSDNLFYYKSGYNQNPIAQLTPWPDGLRFVWGKLPTDTGPVPPGGNVYTSFECNAEYSTNSQRIPPCKSGFINAKMEFANCWNGRDLDSPDHRSHMTHSGGGTCPSGWKALPVISLNIKYPIQPGQDPAADWKLSCDKGPGGYCMHGDLWIKWNDQVREKWMNGCIYAKMDCHGYLISTTEKTY